MYNENIVYNSRPSYALNPWLTTEEHQSNFLTGREMIIAKDMPIVVHEASITDKLQQLFDFIGKKYQSIFIHLEIVKRMNACYKRLSIKKGKIYFQYIENNDIVDDEAYAIDKDVFVALNNKSRIPEWTNHKYLPDREIVSIRDFKGRIKDWDYPFVIKPGDELPTAGGYGVMICYNDEDLEKQLNEYLKRPMLPII